MSSLISTSGLNSTQWPVFLRRTSDSIKTFWIFSIAILFLNIVFNGLCYLLVCQFFKMIGIYDQFMVLNPIELLWATLFVYTFGLVLLSDSKSVQIVSSLKPSRHFLLAGVFYLWLLLMVPIFTYSRLIGYFFAEFTLLFYFLFTNQFITASVQIKDRWKISGVLSTALLGLLFITFQVEVRNSNGKSTFLGFLVPQKSSQFSEIESIQKPSQWVAWMRDRNDWTPEQVDQALLKLEQLCPPGSTDTPLYIDCWEENTAEELLPMKVRSEEAVVLKRLESTSIYVRLLGLVGARSQDKFSPELHDRLKTILVTPGRLSTVADRTLNRSDQDQKTVSVVTVRILSTSLK